MPFELRPYPAPTLRPEGEYLQTAWRRSVYPLAARLGAEIRLPDVSPQPHTRLAFEGLEFAKAHAKGNEYQERVMRAFFQESRDIGKPEVLAELAREAGLPEQEFRQALADGAYSGRVEDLLRHAYHELKITGVPYFLIGGQAFTGVQSKETLEQAIEQAGG